MYLSLLEIMSRFTSLDQKRAKPPDLLLLEIEQSTIQEFRRVSPGILNLLWKSEFRNLVSMRKTISGW
jgi:hypothetical protein